MYTGEEIIHNIASKNLTFAASWLLLSIALGSVLTFTFFAAISTSFHCCHKPSKKDEDTLIQSGHSSQKLLFTNVPSTVYPTIQSIFQQEDNEVIDSLSPAYRELPSTHFSYVSSFNASTTSCCENNETTTMPNSTEISVQPHTSSLSSEQLNIQRLSNSCTTAQQDATNLSNSGMSMNITSPAKNRSILKQSPSPTNSGRINDSSQSIHIIRTLENTRHFPVLTTNGITTEGDETIQREIAHDTIQVIKPAIHDGHDLKEPATNYDQRLDEPLITNDQLKEPLINNQRLKKSPASDQRIREDIYRPTKNASSSTVKTIDTNYNGNTSGSLRGASSFGVVELSPKARAFSPDYYALTFRREGSGLSDVGCSSLRGASAFASSVKRSPTTPSFAQKRGASVFGQISEQLPPEDSFIIDGTRKQLHTRDLEFTHKSSSQRHSEVEGLCAGEETGDELLSCTQVVKVSASQSPKHSIAEISLNSVHSVKTNSSKPHCKIENTKSIVKFPTYEDISSTSTIIQRPYSYPNTKPYKTNDELSERTTGYRSSLLNDRKNNYSEKSLTPKTYNRSEVKSEKNPITLTNNQTKKQQQQQQQHRTLYKIITTTSNESIAPITIPAYTLRESNRPTKVLQEKNNLKKPKLNTTYQSLRGASQLGHLGDDDDDVDSDHDAFWDSMSLSFAYESPSEEDVEFGFKEN